MIASKQLQISNKRKAELVAELRSLEFRPFPKISKARKAGEKEPVLKELEEREALGEEEAATGASSDYDYLLGMLISSLTKERFVMIGTNSFLGV